MKRKLIVTLTIFLLLIVYSSVLSAQERRGATANDNRAFIVVTGMTITEDPANSGRELRDLSVAEGAMVKLKARNGLPWEKKTQVFTRPVQKEGEIFYTADFPVILDSTYSISMTFRNGTVIQIDDFRLPKEWKTHFGFHSTIGTSSPASVMRKKEDAESKKWCYIYGLFPLDNYEKLGGTQVK